MIKFRKNILKRSLLTVTGTLSLAALVLVPSSSAIALDGTSLQTDRLYTLKYVALGDSVAAGLGLPLAPNATAEDAACGRSPQAYSSTVAAGINARLSQTKLRLSDANVACQGAVVNNLIQPQTRGSLTMQPQLDKAFAGGTPALITLTIGANDAHWAEFVNACFSAANCNTEANTTLAHSFLASMQSQLADRLSDIRTHSGYHIPPITVVTGYYHPISLQCINPNLTVSEVDWLNGITDDFNAALEAATDNAGWFARFAPLDFSGHDICSADPWLQRPGVPGEPAALHPNARGQQAMGEAVLDELGL